MVRHNDKTLVDDLSDDEMSQLISLAKRVLWASPETRKKIQDHKVNIVPANFYSDIPLISDIEGSFECRFGDDEIYNAGVFEKKTIRAFVESIIAYSSEFYPPVEGNFESPHGFFWNNPAFSYSDAMAYYCILRHMKPQKVLEVGSGFSTLVADQALRKNGFGNIHIIEPYPKSFLRSLDTVDCIIEKFAQDIPVEEFVNLVEGSDVWFIDSTHTVKIGSDCLYIYLKVMPMVSSKVLVHTHDVFLPYGMPTKKALEKHIYWTEQYLLYAYLLDNPKVEVVFGSAYLKKAMPLLLDNMMGGKYPSGGGSIWYELNNNI